MKSEYNRETALKLLQEYTKSDSLLKHAYGVEAAMLWYANYFQQNDLEKEKWRITGLLHDFDYELFPEPIAPDGHPYKGNQILEAQGWSADIREAIMGHATYSGVKRESLMAKTLFAVDELSGLIGACVWVRPDRSLNTLTTQSVKKKFKDKAFARGCNRDDIKLGAEELKIELDQHIENVINAMRPVAQILGFAA
jgi:predicted hydrolase (HD superfamily)